MKNLKISKKLLTSYGVILLLLVISMLVSILNIKHISSQVEAFYQGPFTVQAAANTLNAEFESMQKSVFRAISNEDPIVTNDAIDRTMEAADAIQAQLATMENNVSVDPSTVTRLKDDLAKLAPMRERVLNYAVENQNAEAAAYMEENNIPALEKTQTDLHSLIQSVSENGESLIANLRGAQTQSIVVSLVISTASVIICVLFGIYIAKSIVRPTMELKHVAEQIANGDLKAVVDYHAQDELGSLADSMRTTVIRLSDIITDLTDLIGELSTGNFNARTKSETIYVGEFHPLLMALRQMAVDLSDTLQQIDLSADQVASGADQVSAGAQALSQGAAEQASSIQELAATINEISGQIQNNAQSAAQAREKADTVGVSLRESNEQMAEMAKAMREISESSGEIRKIIKTIEDIAFQTNILALNAAVEAARAGETGKGFAVVADEVRNLARKSSEASQNTAELIERSLKAVENGKFLADETAAALKSVVEGAIDITAQINQIADASAEQALGAAQVTQGIDQISSVVQTNSATAEESAAASQELSGQAQLLKTLAGKFTLRSTTAPDRDETAVRLHNSFTIETAKY